MIFVTVGTQLPFDRLVHVIDGWAAQHPHEPCVAQIGDGAVPKNIIWHRHLPPDQFRAQCAAARCIVSHAGIGSILLAMELQKPIFVMARKAALGEHRNDHQIATAKWLQSKTGIQIFDDRAEFDAAFDRMAQSTASKPFSLQASDQLLETIKDFINAP